MSVRKISVISYMKWNLAKDKLWNFAHNLRKLKKESIEKFVAAEKFLKQKFPLKIHFPFDIFG